MAPEHGSLVVVSSEISLMEAFAMAICAIPSFKDAKLGFATHHRGDNKHLAAAEGER
jgi:hypothetical protein